jgi:hypothetical protein
MHHILVMMNKASFCEKSAFTLDTLMISQYYVYPEAFEYF